MSHLSNALQSWLAAGHTKTEFRDITGVSHGGAMYAFSGATGFSEAMLAQIHQGFANLGRQEEFWPLLLAHVRDHVPEGLEGRVSITLKDSHRLEEPRREPRRDQFASIQEWILSRAHLDPQVMTILREIYLICHRDGAGANNAHAAKPANPLRKVKKPVK